MIPNVLVSYHTRDGAFKDALVAQLRVLRTARVPLALVDEAIVDGSAEWYAKMTRRFDAASIIICLISAEYLANDFFGREEISAHIAQWRAQPGRLLIPVWVRRCLCHRIEWLKGILGVPPHGPTDPQRWVAQDYRDDYDTPFYEVAAEVGRALSDPDYQPPGPPPPAWKPPEWVEISRMPVTGAELFGRAVELEMLDAAWDGVGTTGRSPLQGAGKTNVLAFVAWGGVGKSTLVNKWLEQMAADNYRGAERVFGWTFYSQGTGERVASADEFVAEALARFGDADPSAGTPWDKGERLAGLIRRRRTLLILDGMEPLQSAADFDRGRVTDPALAVLLEELGRENPGLCVITTRQPVALPSDDPAGLFQHDLERLIPEAGRALLRVAGVRGTDAELEAASTALGNHALAVTLLAAYLWNMPGHPATAVSEIPDLPDIGEDERKHPRRMLAAFAARYGDGPEVELLRVLGLFDRPATAAALAAVRADPPILGLTEHFATLDEAGWLRLLARLRADRLVAKEDRHAPDEVDAHPLVREHFGAVLEKENPAAFQEGHSRLYDFYCKQAPDLPDSLLEMAPLFAAVAHGCRAGRRQEAYDEVYRRRIQRRDEFYSTKKLGAFASDLAALAGFFDRTWDLPAAMLREASRAFVLNEAGFDLRALGRAAEAEGPMRAGLEMYVAAENWKAAAVAASNLSQLALSRGDVAGAVAYGRQAVTHADRSGEWGQQMIQRAVLADARAQAGDLSGARMLFAEAEQIQAERQSPYPLLYSLRGYLYCDLLLDAGEYADVLRRATQTINWEFGRLLDIALDHLSLGRAHAAAGDRSSDGDLRAAAARELDAAMAGLRTAGAQEFIVRGLLARAALRREMGEYVAARRDLDEATRIAVRSGFRLHEADARLEWARLYLAEGDRERARAALDAAAKIVSETGYHRRDAAVAALEDALRAGM